MKNIINTISEETLEEFKIKFKQCKIQPEFYEPSKEDTYNKLRETFNRRFDFMPSLIFSPKNTEHVAIAMAFVEKNNIQITVKSGGHDHEGECVATGKMLIDFVKMTNVNTSLQDCIDENNESFKQISIQPGAEFKYIKKELDKKHLSIPHGTCQSVAIAGYTMGGGWGPWTRKYGMACERLMGATIVLGNGEVKYLGTSAFYNKEKATKNDIEGADSKLLWAIRGGGGLSYGIVTEFFFTPFELPEIAHSFKISHNSLPVLEKIKATVVIEAWEKVTASGKYPQLIGTNLKVVAKGVNNEDEISKDAVLEWTMNGHFGGDKEELLKMMIRWGTYLIELQLKDWLLKSNQDTVSNEEPEMLTTLKQGLLLKFGENDSTNLIDSSAKSGEVNEIDEENVLSFFKKEGENGYPDTFTFESWDRHLPQSLKKSTTASGDENGLSLEKDCPAPHKITCKMPTVNWNAKSREQLVCSLQSTLLNGIEKSTISSYITLGAIQGGFYGNEKAIETSALKCAFPYQSRGFTIQYQTWWNVPTMVSDSAKKIELMEEKKEDTCKCVLSEDSKKKFFPTRLLENRALDWMEECRDYKIDNTDGSFISFKDASIPTKKYFGDNYYKLIKIKEKYSNDKKGLLRSRKTIV